MRRRKKGRKKERENSNNKKGVFKLTVLIQPCSFYYEYWQ